MIKMGKTKKMLRRGFALAMSVAMSLSVPGLHVMATEAPQATTSATADAWPQPGTGPARLAT